MTSYQGVDESSISDDFTYARKIAAARSQPVLRRLVPDGDWEVVLRPSELTSFFY